MVKMYKDAYGNYLDHVPSDSTEHDAKCICYKLPGALEEDISSWPTPGRKGASHDS